MKPIKNGRSKLSADGSDQPKMETVAQEAGVSMMTVSRVLNGKTNVRPETRRKVEETIRKMGYTPNFSARSLASAEAPFVGLAYLNPSSGYLGQFLIGALSAARRGGLHVILEACSDESGDWVDELLAFCRQSQLRGLVLPPPLCDDPEVLDAAKGIGLTVVRVSPSRHNENFVSIRIDEYRAAFEMTLKLIEMGHTEIGFLRGPENQDGAMQRLAGFMDAMQQSGITIDKRWIANGDFAPGPALEAGKKMLKGKSRPTAIFASNDDMAAGLYTAALQAGLSIPNDISIVGFDDQPIAQSLWPALTTVHQPIVDMASRAIDVIASKNAASSKGRDIIFPFEIVMRGSLASKGSR